MISGFFQFIQMLYEQFGKDTKLVVAMLIIVGGGTQYVLAEVQKKHDEALSKIAVNAQANYEISKSQGKILFMLETLNDSVKDMRDSVHQTEQKVWQIGRDVYMIKTSK